MKKKINKLFKFRKLPFLISTLKKKDQILLNKNLFKIQKAIYELDTYLESSWKIKDKKLDKFWISINNSISILGFENEAIHKLTAHIRKYQLHELQLRENKLPTRFKLDYYYYYKSCDVRLMREIIYTYNPELLNEISLTDWRYYDLVTEINDDVEDVFEDQSTINGNCFLISIKEIGIEETIEKFDSHLEELKLKSISKFGNSQNLNKVRIHYYTLKRIVETKNMMIKNSKLIKKNRPHKKMKLFKYLNE